MFCRLSLFTRHVKLSAPTIPTRCLPLSPQFLRRCECCSSTRQGFSTTTQRKNNRIEYNWIKGVETLEEYQPGGYHPIMIGDTLNNNRYRIVDKLGFGGYSTVWLARDTRLERYVALKVNISDSQLLDPPQKRETEILKSLCSPSIQSEYGGGLVPVVLDEFKVHGPNGTHSCYTVTPAQCNLRDISFSRVFPLDVARALSYRLAQAVAYIHSHGYVHGASTTSLNQFYETYGKPETVPVSRYDGEEQLPSNVPPKAVLPLFMGKYADQFTLSDANSILLSDFGESFRPATEPRLGHDCHTPPAFRAPEATFEPHAGLSYPSDIWSLATAIWEIMGVKALFSTDFGVSDDEIVAQHVDVLGPLPTKWWSTWDGRSKFFIDEQGRPTEAYEEDKWPTLQESFEVGIQRRRRKMGSAIAESERHAFLDLMRRMLAFQPEERPTAAEVLESEWMVKWALPC